MGKPVNYKIRECLCNSNKADLIKIMESPDFVGANMDIHVYVELIQFRWDAATVMRFAQLADDDQLATLVATAILQAHAVRLKPLFALMKDAPATIKKHQLVPLFLVACDHEDLDAVRTLIEYQCFNPQDSRPVLTVLRKESGRTAPHMELVSAILESHPGHTDDVNFALAEWINTSKYDLTKEKLQEAVKTYLSS